MLLFFQKKCEKHFFNSPETWLLVPIGDHVSDVNMIESSTSFTLEGVSRGIIDSQKVGH